jgi:hypothetical protein
MIIIGSDRNPAFQQIAFVDTETGNCKNVVSNTARTPWWDSRAA